MVGGRGRWGLGLAIAAGKGHGGRRLFYGCFYGLGDDQQRLPSDYSRQVSPLRCLKIGLRRAMPIPSPKGGDLQLPDPFDAA